MKQNFIKQLQLLGLNPKYSGHNKTIYVNNYPNGNLLIDIELSGFKVLKNN